MDRSTLFAVRDMIATRLSDINEEQKDSLIAYSDKELFSVKLELRDVLKKLWAEIDKIDEASTKAVSNIEKNFLEEEISEMDEYLDWEGGL
jgi:hypothetical protein